MLVLTRKVGEQIVVPEYDMVFTVLDIQGGRIRLGISAPPDVLIFREEVWERPEAKTPGTGRKPR